MLTFLAHGRSRYRRPFRPAAFFVLFVSVLASGAFFVSTYAPRPSQYLAPENPVIEARFVADAHMQALAVRDWQSFFSSYSPDVNITVREGEDERVYEGLSGARTLWLGESFRSRDMFSSRIRDVEPILEAQEGDSFTVILKPRASFSGIKEWRSNFVVQSGRIVSEHLEAVPEPVIMPLGLIAEPVL